MIEVAKTRSFFRFSFHNLYTKLFWSPKWTRKNRNGNKRKPKTNRKQNHKTQKHNHKFNTITCDGFAKCLFRILDKLHNSRHAVNEDCSSLLPLFIDQETPGHRHFLSFLPLLADGGFRPRTRRMSVPYLACSRRYDRKTYSLPTRPPCCFSPRISLELRGSLVAVMLFVSNISSKVWYDMLSQCICPKSTRTLRPGHHIKGTVNI